MTFRLRADVKFHDGSPFSAEDVKASYDRIRNPPQGVVSVRQGLVADIDTIETPDTQTVTFRLKRPNRALLYAFANPFNCIYSAAKLKENPSFPVRNVLGTGPSSSLSTLPARIGRASASRTTSNRSRLTSMASTRSSRRAPPSSTRCRAGRSWPISEA